MNKRIAIIHNKNYGKKKKKKKKKKKNDKCATSM